MDKQRPVNKVVHNDAYSASLMEMYTKWMDGDCFQGSNIPEAFEGMDPQSHGAEVEDITKKKKKIDKKEKSIAEGVRCTICGGNHYAADCPTANAPVGPVKEDVVIESHEIEVDGETIIIEKAKGLDGKACWKGYKLAGTKKKGGKTVDNCVKAGFEPEGEEIQEKNGLYANIHAKRKRGGKMRDKGDEGAPTDKAFKDSAKTAKKEEVEYTTEKKLDPVGKEDKDIDNDGDHDKSDKYLLARRKKVGKIIAMSKKK